MQRYGLPLVVAINHFATDTPAEIKLIEDNCKAAGSQRGRRRLGQGWRGDARLSQGSGGPGRASQLHPAVRLPSHAKEKVETIATKVYGAGRVAFSRRYDQLKQFEAGLERPPICIAKTQYSLPTTKPNWGHRRLYLPHRVRTS